MKKIKLLFLFICFICICSCTKNEKKEVENLTISLFENPSTGYQWTYYISDESIVNIVKDEYVSDNENENIVGAGGTRVYEVKGLKEGQTTIVFTYSRSWEEDSINEIIYVLDVSKDKKVTISSTMSANE